jgi:membrane protease YdiL (CAAX protease family)
MLPLRLAGGTPNEMPRIVPRETIGWSAGIVSLDQIALGDIPLFAHLRRENVEAVRKSLRILCFQKGEIVVREGDPNDHRLFIILDGEAVLCKRGVSAADGAQLNYAIETRSRHDIFGAIWVFDREPFPVSVTAKTPLTLGVVDLKPDNEDVCSRHIRNVLVAELRRYLGNYLRNSLQLRVDSLAKEAEFARYRGAVGGIVIAALTLLSLYTLALSIMPRFENYLDVNFVLSPFIILFFALIFVPVILKSGFPPAFFGITFSHWQRALLFSVTASLAFVAAGALTKWTLIFLSPSASGMPLVSFADVHIGPEHAMISSWYWVAVCLYLVLTPVQEFVARCGIQAPLYAFLRGSEARRRALSILVSNLVFSAAHAHIGLAFALAAFLPGLFWGWIFARTNSLLAASASHFLIGGAGIFLFGIQEFVQKLF